MLSILGNIPVGKLVYSAVLLALIIFLSREVYSVWFDSRIYVGKFSYFSEGKSDNDLTTAFPVHVLSQHHLLRSALIDEGQRRKRERPASPAGAEVYHRLPTTLPGVERWQSALSEIELKIQGFDLGKLLSQVRGWVNPPQEISGFVEKAGNVVRASVTWPHDEHAKVPLPAQFETGPLSGDTAAAFVIAANLVWSQAAEADEKFRETERETFVAWIIAWWDYRTIRDRREAELTIGDDDRARWRRAQLLATKLIPKAEKYPEIWRLRADIIDLNLEGKSTPEELAIAKQDRDRFASALGLPVVIASAPPRATTTESAAAAPTLRPGQPVWFRIGATDSAVTTTAVVVDEAGKKSLLVPDYALGFGEQPADVEFKASANGPVIARAGKANLLRPKDTTGLGTPYGVALAPLADGVEYVAKFSDNTPITKVAGLPATGAALRFLSSHGEIKTTLRAVDKGLAETPERVSKPGDAGTPVVDADGNLVAMGYLGKESGSMFLPLKWVFDEAKLKLAQ